MGSLTYIAPAGLLPFRDWNLNFMCCVRCVETIQVRYTRPPICLDTLISAMCTYTLTLHQCPGCNHVQPGTGATALQPCHVPPSPPSSASAWAQPHIRLYCTTATPVSETRRGVLCPRCATRERTSQEQANQDKLSYTYSSVVDASSRSSSHVAAQVGNQRHGDDVDRNNYGERGKQETRAWWARCIREWNARWGGHGQR